VRAARGIAENVGQHLAQPDGRQAVPGPGRPHHPPDPRGPRFRARARHRPSRFEAAEHPPLLRDLPIPAKIADFGLAKHFAKADFSGITLTGTPLFLPREQIINFKSAKPVSDIRSMDAPT